MLLVVVCFWARIDFYYLYRQCNEEDSVWATFNYFYVAVMYHIYNIWKTQNKTIQDSGYVLQGKITEISFVLRVVYYLLTLYRINIHILISY